MNASLIDQQAIAELVRQIGPAKLQRVVGIQLVHGRALLEKLGALGPAPDPHAVRLLAHQIAGSSASLGMVALGDAASRLETLVLSGTQADLSPNVQALWTLGVQSHDALEAQFGAPPTG